MFFSSFLRLGFIPFHFPTSIAICSSHTTILTPLLLSLHFSNPGTERPRNQSLPTRQFLLTNAITDPTTQTLRFRIPLDIISESIPQIGEFPYLPPSPAKGTPAAPTTSEHHETQTEQPTWSGPTLFIKGAHSAYINHRNLPSCRAFFPHMQLETLDAGHWVHAERPAEFVDAVEKFLRAHTPPPTEK